MNRQRPYGDASVNRYAASQQPQMSSQRMQQNAQMNDFHGRQQWDTNPQIEMNPMSPHSYSQGHKGNMMHSQERMANQNAYYENQSSNEKRHEQDMEIGYEDKSRQLTFEGIEQRFEDEIMRLIKEQSNAEDEEIARHKERIEEMNMRYQENLSTLRVRHASRVGEFLRKESQTRMHQYQQAANAMRPHPRDRGPPDGRDYGGGMGPEAGRPYGTMPDDSSYREHGESMRSHQGYEPRAHYPHGRVYNNNSGARYY